MLPLTRVIMVETVGDGGTDVLMMGRPPLGEENTTSLPGSILPDTPLPAETVEGC